MHYVSGKVANYLLAIKYYKTKYFTKKKKDSLLIS